MNVTLISREYPPFFGGGIGTYADRYSWSLAQAGHRAIILTVSDDGREHRQDRDGVVVIRLPFIKGNDWSGPHPNIATPEHVRLFRAGHPVSLFSKIVADAMPGLIREFKIDVIEAPDTGALGWHVAQRAIEGERALANVPIVATIHSPSAWIAKWNREPIVSAQDLALVRMEREQAHRSDAITCPSHALATWAEDHWNLLASSVHVVPYPLGPLEDRAKAAARSQHPRTSIGETRALFIGRLEPRKGVDTLLVGAAIALQRGIDLRIDLAGEDMMHPERRGQRFGAWCVNEFVPEGLRSRIRLLGRKTPEELATLVASADVSLVPSPMDNFPITCMEAMSAGRVVVAARAGGMGEMIVDGVSGILFAPGDATSCAEALTRAARLTADESNRMGNAAAERMLALCGNGTIIAARIAHYAKAIRDLAERGRPRVPLAQRAMRTVRQALRL